MAFRLQLIFILWEILAAICCPVRFGSVLHRPTIKAWYLSDQAPTVLLGRSPPCHYGECREYTLAPLGLLVYLFAGLRDCGTAGLRVCVRGGGKWDRICTAQVF